MVQQWYEVPVFYFSNPASIYGPDDPVPKPADSAALDCELEIAAVIGAEGIAGFTLFADWSARDLQAREMTVGLGPAKGKDFDTGNALGPVIVTPDEIGDPTALTMVARVNGQERVRTISGGMQHSIADTLVHISQSETLYPGDVVGLGTVGNGCGYESLTFLNEGDVVELEIERIGILRNRLVRS